MGCGCITESHYTSVASGRITSLHSQPPANQALPFFPLQRPLMRDGGTDLTFSPITRSDGLFSIWLSKLVAPLRQLC